METEIEFAASEDDDNPDDDEDAYAANDGYPRWTQTVLCFHIDADRQVVRDWLLRFDPSFLDNLPFERSWHSFEKIGPWLPRFAEDEIELQDPPHLVSLPARFMKFRLFDLGRDRTEMKFTLDTRGFYSIKRFVHNSDGSTEVLLWNEYDAWKANCETLQLLQRMGVVWPGSREAIDSEVGRLRSRWKYQASLRDAAESFLASILDSAPKDDVATSGSATALVVEVAEQRTEEDESGKSREAVEIEFLKGKLPKKLWALRRWQSVYRTYVELRKKKDPALQRDPTLQGIKGRLAKEPSTPRYRLETLSLILRAGDKHLLDDG